MKRKIFFPIVMVLIAGLIVGGIFYFNNKDKRYSFNEIISYNEGDVSAITVDYDKIEIIRDQNEIKKFLASFSKLEFSKINERELKKYDEDFPSHESSTIALMNDNSALYLINLYDNGTIEIYDRTNRKRNQYKILNNDFNFKELVKLN